MNLSDFAELISLVVILGRSIFSAVCKLLPVYLYETGMCYAYMLEENRS